MKAIIIIQPLSVNVNSRTNATKSDSTIIRLIGQSGRAGIFNGNVIQSVVNKINKTRHDSVVNMITVVE